jgi:hypothetical protein
MGETLGRHIHLGVAAAGVEPEADLTTTGVYKDLPNERYFNARY